MKTATEEMLQRNMNQIIENRNLTMMHPYFVNQADQFAEQRKNRAIKANIEIGWKFFCWHDYTFIVQCMFPKNGINDVFLYGCTKCGNQKRSNTILLENLLN